MRHFKIQKVDLKKFKKLSVIANKRKNNSSKISKINATQAEKSKIDLGRNI